jgi:undecaprenyl-diphosphatase
VLHELAHRLDDAAERAVGAVRNPVLDQVAYALGAACDHSLLWHAISAARGAKAGSWRPVVRLSGALAVESALTNGVVKSVFRRVRPDRTAEVVEGPMPFGMRIPITTSFPSGHAGSAFCAATILADETESFAWYALATVVAASRVYVRMHHATDVLAGAALGCLIGRAVRVALPR